MHFGNFRAYIRISIRANLKRVTERNEIETKRNEINANETKRNDENEAKRNKTKPTKAKRNQLKQNEID